MRHHPPPLLPLPRRRRRRQYPAPFSLFFFSPSIFFSNLLFFFSFLRVFHHAWTGSSCLPFNFASYHYLRKSHVPNRQITLYSFLLEHLFVCVMSIYTATCSYADICLPHAHTRYSIIMFLIMTLHVRTQTDLTLMPSLLPFLLFNPPAPFISFPSLSDTLGLENGFNKIAHV
jgi:hypothetical protein